jgi:hypothetical protein
MDEVKLNDHEKDVADHKKKVSKALFIITRALEDRANTHDDSKMDEPEFSAYSETIPKLKGLEYGTDEHRAVLAQMKPAVEHHYSVNRHHPEFFGGNAKSGIYDMNLIDFIEMICDWKAASMRGGDNKAFYKSLNINKERFGLSGQVVALIANTAEMLEGGSDEVERAVAKKSQTMGYWDAIRGEK